MGTQYCWIGETNTKYMCIYRDDDSGKGKLGLIRDGKSQGQPPLNETLVPYIAHPLEQLLSTCIVKVPMLFWGRPGGMHAHAIVGVSQNYNPNSRYGIFIIHVHYTNIPYSG